MSHSYSESVLQSYCWGGNVDSSELQIHWEWDKTKALNNNCEGKSGRPGNSPSYWWLSWLRRWINISCFLLYIRHTFHFHNHLWQIPITFWLTVMLELGKLVNVFYMSNNGKVKFHMYGLMTLWLMLSPSHQSYFPSWVGQQSSVGELTATGNEDIAGNHCLERWHSASMSVSSLEAGNRSGMRDYCVS